MPVTGLRSRFFAIILTVLLIVTAGAVYLYAIFLQQERLALIDQQVRETAAALVDSQLGDFRKIDFDQADEIISEELGESRIGKFFIIRNSAGETIFESSSAQLLPIAEVPKDQKWFKITTKGKFIRGLNLKLPRFPDRTLQVGIMLEESIVNPSYFSKNSFVFVSVVLVLGLIASFLLTSFLLHPIALLSRFLSEITSASHRQTLLPNVPDYVAKNPDLNSSDEFERVTAGLNELINKVNKNYQFSRLWAYQMAHELKTPLSLANMEIEKLQKRLNLSPTDTEDLTSENLRISETINSFLGWAELENSSSLKHLFMNQLSSCVKSVVERMNKNNYNIVLELKENVTIPANPQHLEQLIQNLIQNAINYGGSNPVTIRILDNELQIEDCGPGISDEVVARLGEPFNRGSHLSSTIKGHGLGLAWVMSICRLYGWKITFLNQNPGALISVKFKSDFFEFPTIKHNFKPLDKL